MVKEFASVHNTTQIKKLLTVLGRDFALSKNANYKKGGLIGLAAMAVALGKVSCDERVFCVVLITLSIYATLAILFRKLETTSKN